MNPSSSNAVNLAGLAVEYCKAMAVCREQEPRDFLREVLRYLPRIYVTLTDTRPYGEDSDPEGGADETGAIYETLTEEQYNEVRDSISAVLGENDMYLDTAVEDMRYSDTPVAVSLSEQLADIYQQLADFAATVSQISSYEMPDAVSELKYRFDTYLSTVICSALRAADYTYRHAF